MGTESGSDLSPSLGNVLFDVWLAARATTALVDDAVRASGLNADEFAVYSVLAATDGMAPSDLARWMSAPATTVSSYIGRFTRRGHVRRVPNPEDGRSYLVQLTEAGRAAHLDAGRGFLPLLDEVTRRLGPDADEMHERLAVLHRILAGAADSSPEAGPPSEGHA
ncbi:winged helix DNA-binding protein [Actinotalea sp. M2MS4P-6]|uniref:MarR family winged helix-turn-helix transcriptional regulator n=1 Tax=Actinotalea sp. M2MS4P-6 TaxID=2983762 RepID=UPI0021E4710A|nr:winged helix DNA-binding protein [Actinotalea sp. M2MS4P-6]MCV2392899.1 winged helix DNA-binding protein [Actinotalea sp. M2MS4P-6]